MKRIRCCIDSFQMVRQADGWRILTIGYSARADCPAERTVSATMGRRQA